MREMAGSSQRTHRATSFTFTFALSSNSFPLLGKLKQTQVLCAQHTCHSASSCILQSDARLFPHPSLSSWTLQVAHHSAPYIRPFFLLSQTVSSFINDAFHKQPSSLEAVHGHWHTRTSIVPFWMDNLGQKVDLQANSGLMGHRAQGEFRMRVSMVGRHVT